MGQFVKDHWSGELQVLQLVCAHGEFFEFGKGSQVFRVDVVLTYIQVDKIDEIFEIFTYDAHYFLSSLLLEIYSIGWLGAPRGAARFWPF